MQMEVPLHSFLGVYRIHNLEQNTMENESMSPHLYLYNFPSESK